MTNEEIRRRRYRRIIALGGSSSDTGSASPGTWVTLFDADVETYREYYEEYGYIYIEDIDWTIEEGVTYKVTGLLHSGITVAHKNPNTPYDNTVYIGNLGLYDPAQDDGSGYEFCGYNDTPTTLIIDNTDPAGIVHLKIEKLIS